MIDLEPIIDRIKALLKQDTDASVTYAALEARLALEKIVYDRLRHRHDYISHAQLSRWQPREMVKTLLAEVDDDVESTVTLRMSNKPFTNRDKYSEADVVTIGTEIGLDAKKLAKMWQALANLALHVEVPKSSDDPVSDYGPKAKIARKVSEVMVELARLSKSTMASSGFPKSGVLSFTCSCGEQNKKRVLLLDPERHIHCINPACIETWRVKIEDNKHSFMKVTIDVACGHCSVQNYIPWRRAMNLKRDEGLRYPCRECGRTNTVWWQLLHGTTEPPTDVK